MGGFARRAISLIQKYAFALKGQVQTTTGLETNDYWSVLKRLFVSYANNYSIALRANSGLSAIDYCFTPPPQGGSLSERLHSASTACEAVCSNVLTMLSDGTIKKEEPDLQIGLALHLV